MVRSMITLKMTEAKKSIPSFFNNGIIERNEKPVNMSSELSEVAPLLKNNKEIQAKIAKYASIYPLIV